MNAFNEHWFLWTLISADNIAPRHMDPALEHAGLRKFRFHDRRHTFGSLLIQAGVNVAYVQPQIGHASIPILIDIRFQAKMSVGNDTLYAQKPETSPARPHTPRTR